jgi:hypothetical protein
MKRNNLTAAVLAGLVGAVGIVGSVQAVNQNPDGLGQVLIYPYYTTNGGNQTILSVVNTTEQAKAVKVRFLEGQNSQEVLDFNLYLSAYDVWVAAIADDNGTPTLFIPDNSCTVPYLFPAGSQAFLNFAYDGDGGDDSIARAAEGHFEMIEMGVLTDEDEGSAFAATHAPKDTFVASGTNKGDPIYFEGVPHDCDQLVDAWTIGDSDAYWADEDARNDITHPTGGLFGGAAIVNAAAGTMYSYDATALNGFSEFDIHARPGSTEPSLNAGEGSNSNVAYVFSDNGDSEVFGFNTDRSIDAVSAVFMHDNVMNEYNTEELLNASSEWVLTFPTKRFYVDEDIAADGDLGITNITGALLCTVATEYASCSEDSDDNSDLLSDLQCYANDATGAVQADDDPDCRDITWSEAGPLAPFSSIWDGEACEEIVLVSVFDRSEQTFEGSTPGTIPPIVSPEPPSAPAAGRIPFQVCAETNIIRFGEDVDGLEATEILGSPNFTNFDPGLLGFESGWVGLDMTKATGSKNSQVSRVPLLSNTDDQIFGLPVTGFWVEKFENGTLEGGSVKANYGGIFGHKATRKWILD